MRDMHDAVQQKSVIYPQACGVTGTGVTGKVIDRQGYDSLEFFIHYGSVSGATATVTMTVLEGDATGSLASVADADLLGTEVLASLATGARASGTTKNVGKRIGYKGNKRYVTVKEVPTVTAGALVSVMAVLSNPSVRPTANPA